MKLDTAALMAALKAKSLPMVESDMVKVVDAVLEGVQAQAVAQAAAGDFVASVLAIGLPAVEKAVDAEAAALIPPVAP